MSNRLILLGLAAFAAGIVARIATEPPQPAAQVAFVNHDQAHPQNASAELASAAPRR